MNRRIVVLIGIVAAVVAVVLYVALKPDEEQMQERALIAQLDEDVEAYRTQIDSLEAVIDDFNNRLNTIRSHMDSARAANQVLVASLQKVTAEMKEYRRLYAEQKALNDQLRTELAQVKAEKDRSIAHARHIEASMDSLDNELYEQRSRVDRLEARLQASVEREEVVARALSAVFLLIGTEKELEGAGYLKVWDTSIFTKGFKRIGFPDVAGSGSPVVRAVVGDTLTVEGEVRAVADRHGKLKKKKEYQVEETEDGRALLTFIDPTLEGQRVLVVIKPLKQK